MADPCIDQLPSRHQQYENPTTGEHNHERVQFSKTVPTEILWEAGDRLFEEKLPTLISED